jgi:hypothetical protein
LARDFWINFAHLRFLRCSWRALKLEELPQEHHSLDTFATTDSIDEAPQMTDILQAWVEPGVKRLDRLVIQGNYQSFTCNDVVQGLMKQLASNGTKLLSPKGKCWNEI